MDLKEYKLKPVQEENYVLDEEEEEDEEALSLCDLALSNNISNSDSLFKEDQSSSYDEDLFEFFSPYSSTTYPKDSIIFCGKLIPHKGENEANKWKTTNKNTIFPWRSYTFNVSRSKSLKMEREKSYRNCKTFQEMSSEKCDFRAKKVSRWYLLAFGGGRYSGEMELKDIKTRQNKLSDGKPRRIVKSPARETVGEKSGKREKSNWWSLLRILGCQSSHANAMVKASLGVMPDV